MKKFDLVRYFELSETLSRASTCYSKPQAKGYELFFSGSDLSSKAGLLITEDNGLQAAKHVATELVADIGNFIDRTLMADGNIISEKFDEDFQSWRYNSINLLIIALRTVYLAECRDLEVYSVGQISIYRTAQLVAGASSRISADLRRNVPKEALDEFDEAGRCLAYQLPTACGFHALRALELMMGDYLKKFNPDAAPKSWFDFIKEFGKIADDKIIPIKPSLKVVAMLDRMRVLDLNPLMHPQDRLDIASADMLFNLSAITVSEMARDLSSAEPQGELLLADPAKETLLFSSGDDEVELI